MSSPASSLASGPASAPTSDPASSPALDPTSDPAPDSAPSPALNPTSSASPAVHAAKWILAMVGVAVLYLVLQIAVAMVGGTVLAFVEVVLHGDEGAYGEALAKSAIYGNGIQVVLVAFQLIAVAVFFLPWWRRMRPGSFAQRREDLAPKGASRAKTVAALLLVGIAAQFFVSGLLGLVEMFAPEAIAEYSEMMADSSTGIFVLVAAVSTAILAPINEEIVCRGIMLEYAMRAVSPWWSARERARRHAVSARAFWVANILQALAFGVLHMNLIQGELCVRPRHRGGLGLLAHRQAALLDPAAFRPERLVVSGGAACSVYQYAARAGDVRPVWGDARGGHMAVRQHLGTSGTSI